MLIKYLTLIPVAYPPHHQAVNTNFHSLIVFDWTQPGIEPKSTVSVALADARSTEPLVG